MELSAVALGLMEVRLSRMLMVGVLGSCTAVAMASSTHFMASSVISAD
jgi:hypothetical protein